MKRRARTTRPRQRSQGLRRYLRAGSPKFGMLPGDAAGIAIARCDRMRSIRVGLYPYRIEPHVVTIDMEEAAGRSVYLRIENRPDDVIRPYGADIASQPDVRIAAAIDELWLELE